MDRGGVSSSHPSRAIRIRRGDLEPADQRAQHPKIAIAGDDNPTPLARLRGEERIVLATRGEPGRAGACQESAGTPRCRRRGRDDAAPPIERRQDSVVQNSPRPVSACARGEFGDNDTGQHRRWESPAQKSLETVQLTRLPEARQRPHSCPACRSPGAANGFNARHATGRRKFVQSAEHLGPEHDHIQCSLHRGGLGLNP